MIEVKFTGQSVPEVIGQMLAFIGETRPQDYPTKTPKRGRPPKLRETLATEEEWKASFVEEETVETPAVEPVRDEEPDEVEQAEAPASDAIANEKVKQEVIAQLSDLFTAGKVKTLRHILDTYGNGAKSFPEIDASQFPAIKEALSRGEAA